MSQSEIIQTQVISKWKGQRDKEGFSSTHPKNWREYMQQGLVVDQISPSNQLSSGISIADLMNVLKGE